MFDLNKRPGVYEKAGKLLWQDSYIQRQMLKAHLDFTSDAASRRPDTIQKTVEWLTNLVPPGSRVLDLGCGPGLYAEEFAQLGYHVTAVDINEASIALALNSAEKKGLDIEYICADYTEFFPNDEFDLIYMIYCDMGVLIPLDRDRIIKNCYASLTKGGYLIFDVFDKTLADTKPEGRSWSYSQEDGFFGADEHYVLSEIFQYPEYKSVAVQHVVLDSDGSRVFRTWETWYDDRDLINLLRDLGFMDSVVHRDIIPRGDFVKADVLLVEARK